MRLAKVLLCATALVSSCSALADPTGANQPPAYSWTGFHIGAGAGGAQTGGQGSSYSSYSYPGFFDSDPSASTRSDLGKFGLFGSIGAGADYQFDRFVVGAFADFDFQSLNAKTSATSTITFPMFPLPTARRDVWYKVGDSWDAGVRLGYLVNDRNLVYALGGYSAAKISSGARLSISTGGPPLQGASQSAWRSGYVIGAGWENAISDHWTLGLEYRYTDYGKAKSSYSSSTPALSYAVSQSGDVSVQSVRAVLSYKFGDSAASASQPAAPTLAAAPYSWTGFHIGAGGGLASMRAKDSSNSYLTISSGPFSFFTGGGSRSDLGKFGAFATIAAGADCEMDRFVVGAFTDFDLRSLKARNSTSASTYFLGYVRDTWYKVGDSWDAGARLGYLVSDRNLVYALGGYSAARISSGARLSISSGGPPLQGASQSAWRSGYVIGAGWENAISDHWTLGLEYRYTDYGKAKSSYSSSIPPFYYAVSQSGDVSVQSVRAVLGYKF